MNLNKHKDNLLFLPLGGAGEIGMNVNLYHYKGKWIIIDLGAGFADETLPGVDMVAPNLAFVEEHLDDFLGIVLTHAHEDHLGGIPHLWHNLQLPIYATPFTSAFLKAKLVETPFAHKVKIHEQAPGSVFNVGDFKLEYVQLTHSIPEMNAVILHTEHGPVLHTGDWKFDPEPLVGPVSNHKTLEDYGKEGVLAMVCDSTNVFKEGRSGSEGELRKSLIKLVGECEELVAVTTFASNVARIETIAKAAEANGRKVALAGRSLWRVVQAAKDSGYLQDAPEFMEVNETSNIPRDKLLVICTGCQGEHRAATAKLIDDALPGIKLRPGDTMIFSSKVIPGNEKRIFAMFNELVRRGINLMTEKDHFVHVSGHPSRDELREMYQAVKPEIAIPVHGEIAHIHAHAKLAKDEGAKQTATIEDGMVVKLAPGGLEHIGVVDAGCFALDGNSMHAPDSFVMRTRRKMMREGIICVAISLSKHGDLLVPPQIFAPGLIDPLEDDTLLIEMSEEIEDFVALQNKAGNDYIEKIVRRVVRRAAKTELGKNPTILVNIERE